MSSDLMAAPVEYPAPVVSARKSPKVLVVDADRHSVDYLRFFLEEAGFVTTHSPPGSEALQAASRTQPRVVIAEILSPEMDGFSLCRRLKGGKEARDVRVILMSPLEARELAQEAGADAFLKKPVPEAALVRTVRSLIDGPHLAGGRSGSRNGAGWNV
jgi:CheY-like chemotaxis protein